MSARIYPPVTESPCYSTFMTARQTLRRIPIKVQLRMIFMDVCCGPPSLLK
jgi:hypothetical protein